jgi:hypothetical protein
MALLHYAVVIENANPVKIATLEKNFLTSGHLSFAIETYENAL